MLSHSYLNRVPNEQYILENDQTKEELIRIMIQTLENLGYRDTAQKLIEESKIKLENQQLQKFRESIFNGNWNEALNLIGHLGVTPENFNQAIFLIHEQKYIELILEKNYAEAIKLMKEELTKYCPNPERLHKLAGLMICKDLKEINTKLNRTNNIFDSRKKLIDDIQSCCRPDNMIQANRINKLLHDSICYQVLNCKWHSETNHKYSLLEDHECKLEILPSRSIQTLKDHKDEVWLTKFSPNGNYIAAVARNYDLIIWNFDNENIHAKLKYKKEKIHEKEINCLNWSNDSKKMLTASGDKKIKLWDAETGEIIKTLSGHIDIVCVAIFLPDNQHFISGGIDEYIIQWNKRGEQVDKMPYCRVLDIYVPENGNTIYTLNAGANKIGVLDIIKKKEIHQIKEKDLVISAAITKDNRYLVVNTSYKNPELHLWDLITFELVQRYTGHYQEKFMIRCTFGGAQDHLISCGGEDGKVHIWHRNMPSEINVLNGHSLTVNSVSWHPKNPKILISGSDDYTVKIWVSEDIAEKFKGQIIMEEEKPLIGQVLDDNEKNLEELPHLSEDDIIDEDESDNDNENENDHDNDNENENEEDDNENENDNNIYNDDDEEEQEEEEEPEQP